MSHVSPESRRRWILFGVLGVALALRLGVAVGLQSLLDHRWHREFLIEGDANGYWELAGKIARGEDYSIYEPPRHALRMPGFPAVLAMSIVLFGERLWAARLLLACLGAVACWLVYVLGKRIFDERTGLLAAGLAAISPVLIVFSVEPLSETCFALTLLLGLIAGTKLVQLLQSGASWPRLLWQSVLTGAAFALGCFMRPSWILVAPIFAALLLLLGPDRRRGLVVGAVSTAAMILCLLPWGIRNQQVTGHFTLTTFWMGPSLYDGLNPHATGDSDMRFFDEENLSSRMSEYDVDQHYRHEAWAFAKAQPRRVLELAVEKFWRYWKPWPNAAQFDRPWMKLAVALYFVPVLVLSGLGIWRICLRRPEQTTPSLAPISGESSNGFGPSVPSIWAIVILTGPILYFAALHLIFVSSLRYRLPAEYPLLVLAAAGWRGCRWNVNRPE